MQVDDVLHAHVGDRPAGDQEAGPDDAPPGDHSRYRKSFALEPIVEGEGQNREHESEDHIRKDIEGVQAALVSDEKREFRGGVNHTLVIKDDKKIGDCRQVCDRQIERGHAAHVLVIQQPSVCAFHMLVIQQPSVCAFHRACLSCSGAACLRRRREYATLTP